MNRFMILLFVLTMTACASPIQKDAPLVGRWSTGFVMSQLGPRMTRYTFRSDNTFDLSFTTWFMRASDSGPYHSDAETITLIGEQKTSTLRLHFDGDDLVLRDSDTYRLHKIGNAK